MDKLLVENDNYMLGFVDSTISYIQKKSKVQRELREAYFRNGNPNLM